MLFIIKSPGQSSAFHRVVRKPLRRRTRNRGARSRLGLLLAMATDLELPLNRIFRCILTIRLSVKTIID